MSNVNEKQRKKGRKRTVRVGVINITTHPHSPEKYIDLLIQAKNSKRAIAIHGKHYGLLGSITPLNEKETLGPQVGEFHRYFNLDLDGEWYDIETQKIADQDDIETIVIPDNLKPDFESFRFVFYPNVHRLFFETKAYRVGTLSPNQVKAILDGLFTSGKIIKNFGKVDVVIEPMAEQLDLIFKMPKLRRLEIELTRPNADDLSKTQVEVFDRMDAENAEAIKEIITAQEGKSLQPTKKTKLVCEVAASNGKVTGHGLDQNNRALTESTVNHPWIEVAEFFSGIQSEREAFLEKAMKMLADLIKRTRK